MAANGANSNEDTEIAECNGEKVVTMMDVLQEQQDFEDDANAVLGASDDKNCTYSKGYIKRQAIYACLTCCPDAKHDESKRAGVCLACSLNCHDNHDLVELYTKRNFRCDCGNPKFNSHPCQFTPNKTDLNDGNNYNQNFAGIYCTCHRTYPDPEALEEDEMIQCIICEDWLHFAHLESVVPPADQYAEMVCKDCMKKNEFLQDYSDIAVMSDNFDVDIVSTNPEPSIVSVTTITNDAKELFTDNKDLEKNGQNIDDEMNNVQSDGKPEQNGPITDVVMTNDNLELSDGKAKQNDKTPDLEMNNENSELSDEKVLRDIEAVLENKSSEENNVPMDTSSEAKSADVAGDQSIDKESNENEELLITEEGSLKSDEGKKADEEKVMKRDEEKRKDIEFNENASKEIVSSSNLIDNELKENNQMNETEPNTNKLLPEKENGTDEIKESNILEDCTNRTDKETSENKMTESNNIRLEDDAEVVDKNRPSETDFETTKEHINMNETNDIGHEANTKAVNKNGSDETDLQASKEQIKVSETNDIERLGNTEQVEKDKIDLKTNEDQRKTNEPNDDSETNDIETQGNTEQVEKDNIDLETNKEQLKTNDLQTLEQIDEDVLSQVNIENNEELLNESNDNDGPKEAQKQNDEDVFQESVKASGHANNITVAQEESCSESIQVTETENSMETEDLSDRLSSNTDEKGCSIDECTVQNGGMTNGNVGNDNKRKFDDENESEAKKLKFDNVSRGEGCTRPIKTKKILKGSTFWPSNFRQKLCMCSECILMYKDLSVLFLTDPEDTVTAYEMLGQEKTPSSQYERGLEALSSLGRVQQINALTEYNNMRDKLLDFLKSFKDRKEIVKEDDIKAFFAGMKPKREPDGVYFCR